MTDEEDEDEGDGKDMTANEANQGPRNIREAPGWKLAV